MSQELLVGWKGKAFGALAEYFKLCEERATFEARVVAAREVCEKAGVTFDWNNEPESVSSSNQALACPCGTVVPLTYQAEGHRFDGVQHCRKCWEKAAAQAEADRRLEQTAEVEVKQEKGEA